MNTITFKNIAPIALAAALFLVSYGVAFAATTINVSDESELQAAMTSAVSGDTVMMTSDITTTGQVQINKEITLDGDGYTLSPNFVKAGNSNNSAIGVGADNVTIQNLTIDGSGGTDLHGINVYVSDGVVVDNVSSNHNRSGLVVNGSEVTVTDFSTAGNIWHGINVDQGGGVTNPAVLTVNETSSHGEDSPTTPHIFVDDITKDVTINDVDNQYSWVEFSFREATARTYTLTDSEAPVVEITSPSDGDSVSGPIDITGSITDDVELSHYNLSLYSSTTDLSDGDTHSGDRLNDSRWCMTPTSGTVNTSSNVSGDLCEDWDTTQYADGTYQIRLAARDAAGNRDTSAPETGGEGSVHVISITIDNHPDDKNSCKKGGWEDYGFKNQGQCIKFVNTGKDSR